MKNILASAALSLTIGATSALANQDPHKKFHLYNTEAKITSVPNGETGFDQSGKGVWETNYGPENKHYNRSCDNQADVITIEQGIVRTSCRTVTPGTSGSCTIAMKQNTSLQTAPVGTKVTGTIDCPGAQQQPIDIKLNKNELKDYGVIITNPPGGGATAATYPLRKEANDEVKALASTNPALTAGLK